MTYDVQFRLSHIDTISRFDRSLVIFLSLTFPSPHEGSNVNARNKRPDSGSFYQRSFLRIVEDELTVFEEENDPGDLLAKSHYKVATKTTKRRRRGAVCTESGVSTRAKPI